MAQNADGIGSRRPRDEGNKVSLRCCCCCNAAAVAFAARVYTPIGILELHALFLLSEFALSPSLSHSLYLTPSLPLSLPQSVCLA